jgi:hypothetical protein
MILGVVLLMACACTPDGDPPPDAGVPEVACKNPPTDLAVQFTELQGSVVHWALSEGCIQTSYAPDMQEALPAFQAALSAWDSQACSDLCFTAPVVSTVSPDDFSQRRLHLVSGVPEGSDGQKAQAILTFRVSTGRIVQGVIYVNPHQPGTLSSGDWLAVVGRALGLGTAATGVDSVLSPQRPQPRTALTERDVESFCRLYGQPTFCGD